MGLPVFKGSRQSPPPTDERRRSQRRAALQITVNRNIFEDFVDPEPWPLWLNRHFIPSRHEHTIAGEERQPLVRPRALGIATQDSM